MYNHKWVLNKTFYPFCFVLNAVKRLFTWTNFTVVLLVLFRDQRKSTGRKRMQTAGQIYFSRNSLQIKKSYKISQVINMEVSSPNFCHRQSGCCRNNDYMLSNCCKKLWNELQQWTLQLIFNGYKCRYYSKIKVYVMTVHCISCIK